MIDKNNILMQMKSILGSRQVSFDKRNMHPAREWAIGLMLFIAIIVAGGIHNAQVFVNYRNISTEGGGSSETVVKYNRTLVQTVLKVFTEKKRNFSFLETAVVSEESTENRDASTASSTATSTAGAPAQTVELETTQ